MLSENREDRDRAVNRVLAKSVWQTVDGERKKLYRITDVGERILIEEARRIREIHANLEAII